MPTQEDRSNSAFFRPFMRCVGTGAPPGKMNGLLLRHGDDLRILGAFLYTDMGRLLFYPGAVNRRLLYVGQGETVQQVNGRPEDSVDHITLEANFADWHMSYSGGRKPRGVRNRFRTVSENGILYWAGLCIRDPGVLEGALEAFEVSFSLPAVDAQRRIDQMLAAREGSVFHEIICPAVVRPEDAYLFISFAIDTRVQPDHTSLAGLTLRSALTGGPTVIRAITADLTAIPCRSHPVKIPGFPHVIWVTAAAIPTPLATEMVVSAYT